MFAKIAGALMVGMLFGVASIVLLVLMPCSGNSCGWVGLEKAVIAGIAVGVIAAIVCFAWFFQSHPTTE